jgi:serine protease AprX
MSLITINGVSLDPTSGAAVTAKVASIDASQSDYILIQAAAPLTEAQQAELTKAGVLTHEYVSENTYLCGYKPADLSPVRSLPFVVWAGTYLQGFKVRPSLRSSVPNSAANIVAAGAGPSTSRTPMHVDVVLHDDVASDSTALREKIAAAARLNPDDLKMSRQKVRLTVQERYLDDLAAIDEVRYIEPVRAMKLFNNVARPILNANVVVNGTTYQGKGEILGVNDTGFDKGSTVNVHPAFTGRVLHLTPLGRPGKSDDPDGHGTHVCGSVLGDGNSPSMGGVIQGIAPKAQLVVQSLLDSGGGLSGIPADLNDLFKPPFVNQKAMVQSNSWGSGPGPYAQAAHEIDEFVWNNQESVICFAAGNDGVDGNSNGVIDNGSISSESAAKNCIAVGASESIRPNIHASTPTYGSFSNSKFPVNPIHNDSFANDAEGMAAFSSRGLTKEGRIKPDVVAPGTSILSTRSRAATATPPAFFGVSSDPAFFFDSGTSMATPLVSGCAAVLRETLVKNGTLHPAAALIKALLINGAVELTGQYSPSEAGPSPKPSSGWGRVNLAGSVIIPGPNPNAGFGGGGPLKQGQQDTITIKVPAGHQSVANAGTTGLSPSLKVTLVWTDPPGAMLQNDLDLIVVASNNQELHGNMGTSKKFDRVNNVEQVVWNNIPAGDVKITIRAFHITQFPQPYWYVWRIS